MSEPTPEPTPNPQPTPQPVPNNPQPAPAPTRKTEPAPDPAKGEPAKVEDLPDWAQKTIRELRQESGNARTARQDAEAKQQELLDGIAKALGIKTDDAPPDPAVLQQTLGERENRVSTLEQDLQQRDKEIAAWRVAARQGVNAAALLDSRSFMSEISKLDTTGDDFDARLAAAVKTAVENNPALRGTVVPAAGQVGIGAAGSSDQPETTPGLGRLRQAYANTPQ